MRALASLLLLAACASSVGTPDAADGSGPDAGEDAGFDAGWDAGTASMPDSGLDSGFDSGLPDAGEITATDGGTVITIHYPMPTGHTLTLRGDVAPLNWTTGIPLTAGPNDTWTVTLPIDQTVNTAVDVKPLYDDQTWAIGPNWTVPAGAQADLWPHFFTQYGTITEIDNWTSQILADSRTIWVYTPPSYAENADERFPVAYFQDGQNLFYADLSASGVAWNLQGAMDQGSQDGTIHEAIIIGIANDANRIWEYTPVDDPTEPDGGGAYEYLDFVSQELKPQMDLQYRTQPSVAHTAICGSSLGALVSIVAGLNYSSTFGLIGALSPSTWWDNQWVVGAVMASIGGPQPILVYLDSGNAGTDDDDVTLTAQLAGAYQDAGVDLDYLVQNGGQHSETYWAQRAPGALQFLLGPREFTVP